MGPGLSFEYSSGGADGHLGIGWALAGLHTISRCQATPATDDRWEPIATGGFCLDGMRLIPFGADEYRTEFESQQRVKFEAGANRWTIQAPNGIKYAYNWHWPVNAAVAQTALWRLTSAVDSFNNPVVYEYGDEGEPTQIKYGGNANFALNVHTRRVEFEYENRAFVLRSLRMGAASKVSKRLKTIKLFSPTNVAGLNSARPPPPASLVRQYKLVYRTFSGDELARDQVASISECDANAVCKAAVDLETTTARFAWAAERKISSQAVNMLTLADVNGDGRTDLMVRLNADSWQIMLQLANGSFGTPVTTDLGRFTGASRPGPSADGGTTLRPVVTSMMPSPVDLDLDGMPEMLSAKREKDPGFGDNLAQLYKRNAAGMYTPIVLPGPRGDLTSRVMIADVDGDGRPDILDYDHWNHELTDGGSWENTNGRATALLQVRWNESQPGNIAFLPPQPFAPRTCEPCGRGLPPSRCDEPNTGEARECDSEDVNSVVSFPGATALHVPRKQTEGIRGEFIDISASGATRHNAAFGAYIADSDGDGVVEVNYRQALTDLDTHYDLSNGPTQPDLWLSGLVRRARHVGGRQFVNEVIFSQSTPSTIGLMPARLDDDANLDQWRFTPAPEAFVAHPSGGLERAAVGLNFVGDMRVADLDLDGRDDVLALEPMTARLVRFDLAGRASVISASIAGATHDPSRLLSFQVGDLNNDGFPDLVYPKISGGPDTNGIYVREHLGRAGVLKSISQAGVVRATVSYKGLTPGNGYTPGTNCALPQRCVISGPQIVSSVSVLANEGGATRTVNYAYQDGRTDISGRGWVGFGKVIRQEPAALTREERTYNLTPYNAGLGSHRHAYSTQPTRIETCIDLRTTAAMPGTALFNLTSISAPLEYVEVGSLGHSNLQRMRSLETHVSSEAVLSSGTVSPCLTGTRPPGTRDLATRTRSATFERGTPVDVFEQAWLGGPVNGTPINPPGGLLTRQTITSLWPDETSGNDWRVGLPKTVAVTDTDAQGRSSTRTVLSEYQPGTVAVSKSTIMPWHAPETTSESGFTREVVAFRDVAGNVTAVEQRASGEVRRVEYTFDNSEWLFPVRETVKVAANKTDLVRYLFHVPSTGAIAATEDWNGLRTQTDYDTFSRVQRVRGADGYPRKVVRSENGGHVVTTTTEETTGNDVGRSRREESDLFGRVVRTESSGWGGKTVVNTRSYDSAGRLENESLPFFVGKSPEYRSLTWDKAGRLLVKRESATSEYSEYQYSGTTITAWDPARVKREMTLDARGRPMTSIEPHESSVFSYGPFDTLESIVDRAGVTTSYQYDELGRRSWQHDLNSGETSYRYNSFGELKRIELARGGVLTIERDLLGRETKTILTPGPMPSGLSSKESNVDWDTSPNGKGAVANTLSMDGVSTTFGYDVLGRVDTESTSIPGSGTYTFTSTFDARGNLATLTYPDTTRVLYDYGARGELEGVYQDGVARPLLHHINDVNAAGQILDEQFGNGVQTRSTFDEAYRLDFRETKQVAMLGSISGPALQTFKYDYQHGRIAARHDMSLLVSERYEYDDSGRLAQWRVDQLTGSACHQTTVDYRYDGEGNLVRRESNAYPNIVNTYGGVGGPDAIASTSEGSSPATNFTYDAAGNQLGMFFQRPASGAPDREVTWTYFNLPRTMIDQLSSATQWTLTYDASHNRVLRTGSNGQKEVSLGAGLFSARVDASGTTSTSTVRASGKDVAQLTRTRFGSTAVFVHGDERGSPDAITGGSIGHASLIERAKYDPFGERRNPNDLGAPSRVLASRSIGFTGHQDDGFVGLTNMQGRIYDQHVGRFMSVDPVMATPSLARARNGYSYTVNDPINHTDPTGYIPEVFRSYGIEGSLVVAVFLSLGAGAIGDHYSRDQHNTSTSSSSISDKTTTFRPPADVSPPDNTLFAGNPAMYRGQNDAYAMAADPNESWLTRGTAGLLGFLSTPAVLVDQYVTMPLANSPWVVHNAGIHLGERAARGAAFAQDGDGWGVAIEGAHMVEDFAEGFNAAGNVALLGQSVGNQVMKEVSGLRPLAAPTTEMSTVCAMSCFPAGTMVTTAVGSVVIESLHVGDVVSSATSCTTPEGWDTEVVLDVESSGWRGVARVVLLRPSTWLSTVGLAFERDTSLSLSELGVDGRAHLVGLSSIDVATSGQCVVTGTVVHHADSLVELSLSNGESLRATPIHRLFSATRGEWVAAGELAAGEDLETSRGLVRVVASDTKPFDGDVFNLEISDSHEYRVGTSGVRAHNTCACGQPPLKRIHSETTYAGDAEAKASLEHWRSQPTDKIVESLRPGQTEALRVKPDGRMMNGNTRTMVLEERGFDINKLGREIQIEDPNTFETTWRVWNGNW